MASTSPTVAVKKEKKSKLWSTPPYPGNEQNTKHKGKKKKRRRAPRESRLGSSSGSPDSCDSDSSICDGSGSQSSKKSALKSACQSIVLAPETPPRRHNTSDSRVAPKTPAPEKFRKEYATAPAMPPGSHPASSSLAAPSLLNRASKNNTSSGRIQNTGRTYKMMTVNAKGSYLHPSHGAILTRMNCLYPGFGSIMAGNKDTDATSSGSVQTFKASRASHVEKVWRIVSTVDVELRAKMVALSQPNININKSSPFGVRMNYLFGLYTYTRHFHGADQKLQSATASTEDITPTESLPSHEQMMAYRILSPRFDFPDIMIKALRGTSFEYLMSPIAPAGPAIMDANSISACECPSLKSKIAELEAKLTEANRRLEQANKSLGQHKLASKADKERQDAAANKGFGKLLTKLEAHQVCSAHENALVLHIQELVNKAAKTHSGRLSSLNFFLGQIGQSRDAAQVGEMSFQEMEFSKGEASEGETSEGETSVEEEDDEEDQRPAKIQRTS